MTKARLRVLVTRKLPAAVEARLCSAYDVRLNADDNPMSKAELAAAITQFDALVSTVSDRLEAPALQTVNCQVRIIANVGVGYSNIDIETARAKGIVGSNTPDVLTDATADIALLLILAATRRAYVAERKLREGRWDGLTFEATRLDTADDVMAPADVVSVHVPGGGLTPLVNAGHIATLKPTAYLINTARGDSIDQGAPIVALSEGRIAGAGLDVYAQEPEVPDALRTLDNVTLLPHIGSATEEVRTAMGMVAVDNPDAFFSGADLPCRVV